MNRRIISLSTLLVIGQLLLSACAPAAPVIAPAAPTAPAPTCPPVDTVNPTVECPAALPFTGIWAAESEEDLAGQQLVILSDKSLYTVQTGNWANAKTPPAEPQVHEEYMEIVSYDLNAGTMEVRLKWIRANGQLVGFDSPERKVQYQIDGDTLKFAYGWEDRAPDLSTSRTYTRQ